MPSMDQTNIDRAVADFKSFLETKQKYLQAVRGVDELHLTFDQLASFVETAWTGTAYQASHNPDRFSKPHGDLKGEWTCFFDRLTDALATESA